MEQSERVTVERVRAAYQKTGLIPLQGIRGDARDLTHACGLRAVEVAEEVVFTSLSTYDYRWGFIDGFDNFCQRNKSRYCHEDEIIGRNDGRAAALAMGLP